MRFSRVPSGGLFVLLWGLVEPLLDLVSRFTNLLGLAFAWNKLKVGIQVVDQPLIVVQPAVDIRQQQIRLRVVRIKLRRNRRVCLGISQIVQPV